jgi:hypothetical protein
LATNRRDSRAYLVPLGTSVSQAPLRPHPYQDQESIYGYGLSSGPKVPPNNIAFLSKGGCSRSTTWKKVVV